ncbi:fused response regulator/phosphatase [Streptomyces flavofungini]|uniref:fused response regulator/phosphatase n=1 Tax=Streptomyces flavofungini TaxID=68200 RepID=UPI0025B108D8|nr:fused response regulator/phosphatase [Streptomyces flavofungini]WJV49174.1 fused response regulator/phosphatase [Streptomyces flavofungini]
MATTVLVVDDVAANRYALGAVLRRAGHRVVLAASAGEALSELDVRLRAGELPDVALVDVGLPDMSGYDLCRRLKASPTTASLPVVHFSAAAHGSVDRCRGLDAGGEAYLTVPAEPEEIAAVVRAAARGARNRSAAQTRAGRLSRLAETVLDVQSASSVPELVDAAAAGAAALAAAPAAAFVLGEEGEIHCGRSHRPAAVEPPGPDAHESVAHLMWRLMSGRSGVHTTTVPGPMWPAGFVGPARGASRLTAGRGGEPGRSEAAGGRARESGEEILARPREGCPTPWSDAGAAAVAGLVVPGEGALLALARTREDRAPVCLATAADAQTSAPDLGRLAHATARVAERLLMYEKERHIALTLQHSFLPSALPELPDTEIVVRYEPASRQAEIGGDFYAALPTPAGVLTGIGDVVGHSLDAATVMVELRHALRAYCIEDPDPGRLATRLDRMLQRYHPDVTATMCLTLVDPPTGRVRVANAGHIPPLVVSSTGPAAYIEASGPLLGLGLDRPPPVETRLTPTDRMLMVTDGLIETRGTDLAVSLEHLRLAAAAAPPGVTALCDTLLESFGRERDDDIALLALRLTVPPGGA